ncbi:hypothetical protein MKX03_030347 [Papaver bracteatum]|nr:hypothetical protein MKX03_030347 [Papaver bracteatum]
MVFRVDMHCEACAKKVAKSLRGFEGVEEVRTDCKAHLVVVKGKTADPIKVCERIQKKSGRKVEIISPLPKPPEEEKKEENTENKPAEEEKKDEPPPVITVILNVRMHCEACAQVLHKRIRKFQGVEAVETDLINSKVTVKGIMDPAKLIENVYKKTKKQVSIVVEEKKEEEKKEEEKKEEEKKEEEKKEGAEEAKAEDHETTSDIKKSEYWPPKYNVEYAYAPQIFSDENPNACSVM